MLTKVARQKEDFKTEILKHVSTVLESKPATFSEMTTAIKKFPFDPVRHQLYEEIKDHEEKISDASRQFMSSLLIYNYLKHDAYKSKEFMPVIVLDEDNSLEELETFIMAHNSINHHAGLEVSNLDDLDILEWALQQEECSKKEFSTLTLKEYSQNKTLNIQHLEKLSKIFSYLKKIAVFNLKVPLSEELMATLFALRYQADRNYQLASLGINCRSNELHLLNSLDKLVVVNENEHLTVCLNVMEHGQCLTTIVAAESKSANTLCIVGEQKSNTNLQELLNWLPNKTEKNLSFEDTSLNNIILDFTSPDPSVTELNLSNNRITAQTVKFFKKLCSALPNIKQLKLNEITSNDPKVLDDFLGIFTRYKLTALEIISCNLTDLHINALTQMILEQSITHVKTEDNDFTSESVDKLLQQVNYANRNFDIFEMDDLPSFTAMREQKDKIKKLKIQKRYLDYLPQKIASLQNQVYAAKAEIKSEEKSVFIDIDVTLLANDYHSLFKCQEFGSATTDFANTQRENINVLMKDIISNNIAHQGGLKELAKISQQLFPLKLSKTTNSEMEAYHSNLVSVFKDILLNFGNKLMQINTRPESQSFVLGLLTKYFYLSLGIHFDDYIIPNENPNNGYEFALVPIQKSAPEAKDEILEKMNYFNLTVRKPIIRFLKNNYRFSSQDGQIFKLFLCHLVKNIKIEYENKNPKEILSSLEDLLGAFEMRLDLSDISNSLELLMQFKTQNPSNNEHFNNEIMNYYLRFMRHLLNYSPTNLLDEVATVFFKKFYDYVQSARAYLFSTEKIFEIFNLLNEMNNVLMRFYFTPNKNKTHITDDIAGHLLTTINSILCSCSQIHRSTANKNILRIQKKIIGSIIADNLVLNRNNLEEKSGSINHPKIIAFISEYENASNPKELVQVMQKFISESSKKSIFSNDETLVAIKEKLKPHAQRLDHYCNRPLLSLDNHLEEEFMRLIKIIRPREVVSSNPELATEVKSNNNNTLNNSRSVGR